MKKCGEFSRKLVEFYYRELGEEEEKKLVQHLEACSQCHKEYKEMERALDLLPGDRETPVPDASGERIRRKIRTDIGKPTARIPAYPTRRWMPAVASAVMVLFVAVLTFHFLPTNNSFQGEMTEEEEIEVAENLEVLDNLELLQILEALEEILQTPDSEPNYGGAL